MTDYPSLDDVLDAALDGHDYPTAALCLLAHPNARGLPEFVIEPLFHIAIGIPVKVDIQKHILGADHVIRIKPRWVIH